MRWLICAVILILVISPACAAEVNIFIDKKSVNLGDQIRFQVYLDVNRSVDIAVVGERYSELLCHVDEGEDVYDTCGDERVFTIPEDWEEGVYYLRVLVDNSEEHVKDFKVIRPKITKFELKELVYQSKTELEVLVESANPVKLTLRFYGNNTDLYYEKTADYEEKDNVYSAKFDLNLREMYERTRDIADTIKPGKYIVELRLEYNGKTWDSKRVTVSIVEPEIGVSIPDKIEAGDPLIVSISSNRIGEPEYDGILVILTGKNLLRYKKVRLDENGKASVRFETAGFQAGKYTVYVRDTSKTSTLSITDLAKNYYDLSPNNTFARIIQADDDVLQKKDILVVNEDDKKGIKMQVQPSKAEIFNGSSLTLKVIIDESLKLSSYEFAILVSGNSIKIESVTISPEFEFIDKTLHPDYLKISTYSMEKPNTNLLAEIKVTAQQPGESWLRIKNAGIYDENGDYITPTTNDAHVIVKEKKEDDNSTNVNISVSENVSATPTLTLTPTEIATETITTISTTSASSQHVSMNIVEIDYTKIFMFTAGFLTTYITGKVLRDRLISKGGKR